MGKQLEKEPGKTQEVDPTKKTEDLEKEVDLEDPNQELDQELEDQEDKTKLKAKTPEEYEEEILELRRSLRKTRQEAARRRVDGKQLKQQEGATEEELAALRTEKDKLAAQVAQFEADKRRAKQEGQVKTVAAKLRFKHPEDLIRLGDIEFDPDTDDLDVDEIEGFAKKLARQRPELIDTKEPPDLDSQSKGKNSDALNVDEAELARKYGIRYVPPTTK